MGRTLQYGRHPSISNPTRAFAAILKYHHEAIVHSMAQGDDSGESRRPTQMARRPAAYSNEPSSTIVRRLFQEAWRTGDRAAAGDRAAPGARTFYDQSIWWVGETATPVARVYNNIIAQLRTPPENGSDIHGRAPNDSALIYGQAQGL